MWPLGRVQATSFGLWDQKKWISLTVWARFVKSDAICIDIPRVSLMGLLWPFHFAAAASLVVKVYPERVLASQGGSVTLRCQVSGSPPHYFYWSREDGRPISSGADRRRQGTSHTWSTSSRMISALFILVWSTVKKKFCSSWSEYTNCVYRYAYKITLQAWTRHLLFICVCVQEQSCTSPTSSRVTPASTSVPAETSAAPTGAAPKLLSQVCIASLLYRQTRFSFVQFIAPH